MTRLAELVPFNSGESVASLCSRLAAACGYPKAQALASRLGFSFRGLALGRGVDIQRFASALGTSEASLESGVVNNGERLTTTISGELFSRPMTQRAHLRICPHCILEDEITAGGRRGFRAYGRTEWLVVPVQICREHECLIFTLRPERLLYGLEHDFAAKLEFHREQIPMIARATTRQVPDAYQGYVEGRLRSGPKGNRWLDAFPLDVVGRVCEAVGIVDQHGVSGQVQMLGAGEISVCTGRGYEIICGGEADFGRFLNKLVSRFYESASATGGRALYGYLHTVLATASPVSEYEPFRAIMRDVTLNSVPLSPGFNFLGPVAKRRLHSVYSASEEFDIQPKRLLSLLVRSRKVAADSVGKSYNRIILDSSEMAEFAIEAKQTLSFADAARALGAERSQLKSIIEHGILWIFERSIGGDSEYSRKQALPENDVGVTTTTSFRATDIEELRIRLESIPTITRSDEFVTLRSAAKMANCKNGEVVQLLLDGKLKRVARVREGGGLAALLIDPRELREWTCGPDHGCHTLREVELAIPASNPVVHALIEGGHLKSVQRRNPWKRHMQTVVEPDELVRFRNTFVALGTLAHRHRRTTAGIEKRLAKAGILPTFVASRKKFYRIRDVANFVF
ncbi:TniQ family protein [Agrobacterium tumefaciens]|uniref:TniQ family protein n=1 Tax=Agrobacterium tumefaciens TaxID=358 RepID=UPI003B9F86DF